MFVATADDDADELVYLYLSVVQVHVKFLDMMCFLRLLLYIASSYSFIPTFTFSPTVVVLHVPRRTFVVFHMLNIWKRSWLPSYV